MNQACEELSRFPKIPEEEAKEAVLYRQWSPDIPPQFFSLSLLLLIWDFSVYLMSTYGALEASSSCVSKTDHLVSSFPLCFAACREIAAAGQT